MRGYKLILIGILAGIYSGILDGFEENHNLNHFASAVILVLMTIATGYFLHKMGRNEKNNSV